MDLDERARVATVELRRTLNDRDIELGLEEIHRRMRRRRPARVLQVAAAGVLVIALLTGVLWFRAGDDAGGTVLEPARPCAASTDPVLPRLTVGSSTVVLRQVDRQIDLLVDGSVASSALSDTPGGSRVLTPVQGRTVVWGVTPTRPLHATLQVADGSTLELTLAYLSNGSTVFLGVVDGPANLSSLALSGSSPEPVCR